MAIPNVLAQTTAESEGSIMSEPRVDPVWGGTTVTEARGEPGPSEEQGEASSTEDTAAKVKLPLTVTFPLFISDK